MKDFNPAEILEKKGLMYYETSALSGYNVEKAFR